MDWVMKAHELEPGKAQQTKEAWARYCDLGLGNSSLVNAPVYKLKDIYGYGPSVGDGKGVTWEGTIRPFKF